MKSNTGQLINREQKVILLLSITGSFLAPFMGSSINVALPAIGNDFSVNAILLGWIATIYILTSAVFLLPFGRLADIKGRKRIFSIGLLIFALGSILCSLSFNVSLLLISRTIQAIGSAMVFSTSIAILTSAFPPGIRGRAMGISVASTYTGLAVGPTAGGFLTEYLGWESIFIITFLLTLPAIYLVFFKLKTEWKEAEGEKFDYRGSILYGTGIIMLIYGFSIIPEIKGFIINISGALLLIFFYFYEKNCPSPVLEVSIFRNNRSFTFSNLAALINYCATFAVGFLISLYLQYVLGLSPNKAGLILIAQPIMMAVFSPFAGRLSDKVKPSVLASIGMSISFLGLLLFAFLKPDTPIVFMITNLIFLGLGFAFFSSPNTNAIMSSVEKKQFGIASAFVGTMRMVGQMLSMAIVMMLFSVFLGKNPIGQENADLFVKAVKVAFVLFAILCFIGIFFSLKRDETSMIKIITKHKRK